MVTRYAEYDPFAWVYNRHFGTYGAYKLRFCPILEALVLPELAPHAQVMDLCCGTGQLARWLADREYCVTGLDGSEAMLRFARENAPEASFVLADARSFTMPSLYQAVVSACDSLNHIMSLAELTMAFHNVHAALMPGGVLLCDLNVLHRWGERGERWNSEFSIVEDDHVSAVRTRYDDDARTAYWDMTIFRLQETWERTDFKLTQRIYDETEVCQALETAGFADVQVFDSEHCQEGISAIQHGRAFFLARKEKIDVSDD